MPHRSRRARHLALAALSLTAATFGAAAPALAETCPTDRFVSAWAAAPSDASGSYSKQTMRMIIHPHTAGTKVKVHLTNRYASDPTVITAATISKVTGGAEIDPTTTTPLKFDGETSVRIPAHWDVTSDEANFAIKPDLTGAHKFQAYAIDLFLAGTSTATNPPTRHKNAFTTSYMTKTPTDTGDGNAAGKSGALFTEKTGNMYFVSGLDVQTSGSWGTVATLGDSVTDGVGSDAGTGDGLFRAGGPVPLTTGSTTMVSEDARYPDWLQRRLTNAHRKLSVANVGIGGNMVLQDGLVDSAGMSMRLRALMDAGMLAGVTDVIVLGGGNDLGQPNAALGRFPRASDVIAGLGDTFETLHRSDVKITAVTIHPTGGAVAPNYGDLAIGGDRRAVNKWIRETSGPHAVPAPDATGTIRDRRADAYWDLAAAIGDGQVPSYSPTAPPADGVRIRSDLRTWDGIHPNGLGYRTFVDSLSAAQIASLRGQTCTP